MPRGANVCLVVVELIGSFFTNGGAVVDYWVLPGSSKQRTKRQQKGG
jgi:hypothetical protein